MITDLVIDIFSTISSIILKYYCHAYYGVINFVILELRIQEIGLGRELHWPTQTICRTKKKNGG